MISISRHNQNNILMAYRILFEKMKLHYQTLRIKLGKLQSTLFTADTVGTAVKLVSSVNK